MSDDYGSFEDDIRDALDAGDAFDYPDINDYLTDYEDRWLEVWDAADLGGFTDGQVEAFIEMVFDTPMEEWDDMMEWWDEGGFWDWWEENYGGG